MKSIHGENLCGTCKYAERDYNEKGWFVDNCKKGYPEDSYEDHWGDIVDCPEYMEVKHD